MCDDGGLCGAAESPAQQPGGGGRKAGREDGERPSDGPGRWRRPSRAPAGTAPRPPIAGARGPAAARTGCGSGPTAGPAPAGRGRGSLAPPRRLDATRGRRGGAGRRRDRGQRNFAVRSPPRAPAAAARPAPPPRRSAPGAALFGGGVGRRAHERGALCVAGKAGSGPDASCPREKLRSASLHEGEEP